MEAPSTNGSNGDRASDGRFAKGNRGGPGNPHAKRVAQLKSAFLNAVSREDLAAIVGALVQKAKDGDVAAAREVLDRCLGKPTQPLDAERLSLEKRKLELDEERVDLASERVDIANDRSWLRR